MARVLIPLAEGFEELEAVSVIDILRRGDIEVVVACVGDGPVVRGSRKTAIVPDMRLDEVLGDPFDMIVLPGGMPGVKHLKDDPRIRRIVERLDGTGKYTAAICAAPSILAHYGMLKGRRATSNPKHRDEVALDGIDYREQAVVRDGRIVTSRGPGTAIDFALQLIEILKGPELCRRVADGLVLENPTALNRDLEGVVSQ